MFFNRYNFLIQSTAADKPQKQNISESEKGKVYRDLPYRSISQAKVMDIYLPESNGPFSVVVLIHGGDFNISDRNGSQQRSGSRYKELRCTKC